VQPFSFIKAKPVWAENKTEEMNLSFVFRAVLDKNITAKLNVAGHSDYQIFINGGFVAQGPARSGHGFFRADEIDISSYLSKKKNVICVLAAGYNVNSFYLTDQPPFVCAEIISGKEVLFATGTENDFDCVPYAFREQKVQRFSFQRPFTEYYRFSSDYDRIFTDPEFEPALIKTQLTEEKRFLRRETLRSDYEERTAKAIRSVGSVKKERERKRWGDRSLTNINGTTLKGFNENELAFSSVNLLLGYSYEITQRKGVPFEPVELPENSFAVFDMGLDTTGYLSLKVTPETDAVIWAVFNEKLRPSGVLNPGEDGTACEVGWELKAGRSYRLLSFEPYTYRYIQLISLCGEVKIEALSQISEHYPAKGLLPKPLIPDKELDVIYDAAVETFSQNATDIFMDCPSRERAGWLCDSFFTSRSEYALTGQSRIEKAFLENFLMESSFPDLPEGMLPMCYPSDHPDGTYIPNWAMWYLLELAEYKKRSGDNELIALAKEKMYALAGFLSTFENDRGLLQNLESWVFVEWSRANDFTQDVNFPSNMLYAKFLEDIGDLYGDAALTAKANALKETICSYAFNGTFFLDNAVLSDGKLELTDNHTETAQYYAFFTGVASKETHPDLYRLMTEQFGPGRDEKTVHPDVPVSNAFIGNYLRLEILFNNGEYEKLLNEIKGYFLPMALSTGTIWENMHDGASCCHGFASHIVYWLRKIYENRKNGKNF